MLSRPRQIITVPFVALSLLACGEDSTGPNSAATTSGGSGFTNSSTQSTPGESAPNGSSGEARGGAGATAGGGSSKPFQAGTGGVSAKTTPSGTGGSVSVKPATSASGGATPTSSTQPSAQPGSCQKFSFFITSMAAMIRLSGSDNGFGGDLRYPKGTGEGIAGADAICAEIAAASLPCAAQKTWRAFLSTATEDAIDRIGKGPWYDRKERLVWNNTDEMIKSDRPTAAPDIIRDDLPNEDGVPNHDFDLDGSTNDDDNHDILTGSGTDGRKIATDSAAGRCNEWTSTTAVASGTSGGRGGGNGPAVGHSWPRAGGSAPNWIYAMRAPGCGAGINLKETAGSSGTTVGAAGGYGAIYCFATTE